MDTRLEGLLRGYARLLTVANQQQQYLESTDPNQIKREIAGLQRTINDDPPQVQDINRKRIEILTKRLEKYQKLRDNGRVVDAQCSAVEDVLHLVRDQSVTMRDPQQVSDQLENLVRDVEQTEQTVQQVESIFSSVAPELDGLMSLNDTPASAGGQRIRITS
jgi:chromosome segregation ATPase